MVFWGKDLPGLEQTTQLASYEYRSKAFSSIHVCVEFLDWGANYSRITVLYPCTVTTIGQVKLTSVPVWWTAIKVKTFSWG